MTYFPDDLTEPGGGGPCRPDLDLSWVSPEPAPGPWQKSSLSFCNGNCVEVRGLGGEVEVRDSKNPDGPLLRFTREEWLAFLGGARGGEFDRFGS